MPAIGSKVIIYVDRTSPVKRIEINASKKKRKKNTGRGGGGGGGGVKTKGALKDQRRIIKRANCFLPRSKLLRQCARQIRSSCFRPKYTVC